jgi:hypothetical protein
LSKIVHQGTGKAILRNRDTGYLNCAVNQNNTASLVGTQGTSIEGVLANLKYYDPSNPSVLLSADGAAGTFQKKFLINIYTKLTMYNHRQVPVEVYVRCYVPKEDTNTLPHTRFTQGLVDVGNPAAASTLIYPSDSPMLTRFYHSTGGFTCWLMPGKKKELSFSKKINYDPSARDEHSFTYQASEGCHFYFIMIKGPLSQDTLVTTEVGRGEAGVSYELSRKYVTTYDAGADIKTITLNDGSSAFTNAATVVNKPEASRQPI